MGPKEEFCREDCARKAPHRGPCMSRDEVANSPDPDEVRRALMIPFDRRSLEERLAIYNAACAWLESTEGGK